MAMAKNFGFGVDLEETILRRRQGEPAPPESRRDGHDMTVLEKRMGAEGRRNGRHFNNVSDGKRTGNCEEASAAQDEIVSCTELLTSARARAS
jgi:hypothetical protein